jgi:ATP-dependent Clp protease ATP-binding subunit ClpB
VGYESGGQLTEAVRRRPYSVLLFDEVEKAHPEVFNVFLQILDDGRLTDGQGRVVNFKNTIIILTSNLGSQLILDSKDDTGVKNEINALLKQHFRPEFLNRIDETVIFNRLTNADIGKIIDIQVERLQKRLAERHIILELSSQVKDLIAQRGWDPLFGARPLKRSIQIWLENPLSKEIIAGRIGAGARVKAVVQGDGVGFVACG